MKKHLSLLKLIPALVHRLVQRGMSLYLRISLKIRLL